MWVAYVTDMRVIGKEHKVLVSIFKQTSYLGAIGEEDNIKM